jgi:hypothetical protein
MQLSGVHIIFCLRFPEESPECCFGYTLFSPYPANYRNIAADTDRLKKALLQLFVPNGAYLAK